MIRAAFWNNSPNARLSSICSAILVLLFTTAVQRPLLMGMLSFDIPWILMQMQAGSLKVLRILIGTRLSTGVPMAERAHVGLAVELQSPNPTA